MLLMNPSTKSHSILMVGTCSQLLVIQLSKSGISDKAIFSIVCMDMKGLPIPAISHPEETFSHLLAVMLWSWYGRVTWMRSIQKTLMKRQELRLLLPQIHVLVRLQTPKHQDQLHIEQKVQVDLHLAAKKFKLAMRVRFLQPKASTKVKCEATPHRWVLKRTLLLASMRLLMLTSSLQEDRRTWEVIQVLVSPDLVKNLLLLSRKLSPNSTSFHEPCTSLSNVSQWMRKASRTAYLTSMRTSNSVNQGHTNQSSSRCTCSNKHKTSKWCSHAN